MEAVAKKDLQDQDNLLKELDMMKLKERTQYEKTQELQKEISLLKKENKKKEGEKTLIMSEIDIELLNPHPKNIEIYGRESVSDLVDNIRKYGLLDPLKITDEYFVISGHRRLKACKELAIARIPAIIKHYDNIEDEIEDLVNFNLSRDRTEEQKGREAKALKEVEDIRAEKRRKATQNNKTAKEISDSADSHSLVDTGRATDVVAKKLGFTSGRQVERTISTIDKIDELDGSGKEELADIVRGQLNNKSISAGEEAAKVIDFLEVREGGKVKSQNPKDESGEINIDDLITGKRTVTSLLPKKEKEIKKKVCSKCNEDVPETDFAKGESKCKKCVKEELDAIQKSSDEWKARPPVKANLFRVVCMNVKRATEVIDGMLFELDMADMSLASTDDIGAAVEDLNVLMSTVEKFNDILQKKIGDVLNG